MSEIQDYLTSDLILKGLSSNSSLSKNFENLFSVLGNNKFSSNSISLSIKIEINNHYNLYDLIKEKYVKELIDMNSFLYDIFINQRKMYRYYKAVTELEEGTLKEKDFEEIEKSCVITLKNDTPEQLKNKIIYLYDCVKDKNSEELNYMYDDELADILSISKYNLKPLLQKA